MKVAFLVPTDECELSHWILDGIFSEAYSRWGGARSLIIPYDNDGKPLVGRYEDWLTLLDPDFVYSYVDLNKEAIDRINRLSLPISFIRHTDKNIDRWRQCIPSWSTLITPVSTMSTLTSPYASNPGWFETQPPQIYITQYPDNCDSRFLPDNFAVNLAPNISTLGHKDIYETICYTTTEVPKNHIIGTYRSSSLTELVTRLANKKVRSFSKLSSIHSKGIFTPNDYRWAGNFHIIIGESVMDRINFWNIRNFTSGLSLNEVPSSLILAPTLIEDKEFCKAIGAYLNSHNFSGSSGGSALAYVNSYSLDRDTCTALLEKLRGDRNTWNTLLISPNFSEIAVPSPDKFGHPIASTGVPVPSFKLNDSENDFIAKEPEHFKYLPPNFLFAKDGQWIVDLEVERHNDNSNVVNVYNDWKLPRRLEVLRAFTNNLGKINNQNNMSLIPSSSHSHPLFSDYGKSYKIHLGMPEDETVFQNLILGDNATERYDYRNCLSRDKYYNIRFSDKGQNHRGIVSKFYNVNQAASILTNKYWREIIRTCMKKPGKTYTRNQLDGIIKGLGRRELEPLRKSFGFDNIGKFKEYLQHNLVDTLNYLVHNGIVQQTHKWRCSYCGSHNKRGLDTISLVNTCDVCDKEYNCPIDFVWHYTPSRFVVDTLAINHGLTVLWAIAFLIGRSWKEGAIYLPEVDLFKSQNNKNEIDILAIIEGQYYAGEVKFSVKAFVDDQREIDIFIEEINFLCPDIAILAFEVYSHDNDPDVIQDLKSRLPLIVKSIKEKIPNYINIQTVVAQDIPEFNNFPSELGPRGDRTLEFLDNNRSK